MDCSEGNVTRNPDKQKIPARDIPEPKRKVSKYNLLPDRNEYNRPPWLKGGDKISDVWNDWIHWRAREDLNL